MTANQQANRDLADYLHRRLEYLRACKTNIENRLRADEMDLRQKIDDGVYSKNDPAIGKTIFHLEYVVGNTFRYTMLIGVCSFVEEAMKAIGTRLLPDYDARITAGKRENWLRKHIRVLSDAVGLDSAPIKSHVGKFYDIITLRNCIVHAWGKLAKTRNPQTVKAAIKRLEGADVSTDGYLLLHDEVVSEAIETAEDILESILQSTLHVSMT
jgi:hypothetical protein